MEAMGEEPADLYGLRQSAHELIDLVYDFLFYIRDVSHFGDAIAAEVSTPIPVLDRLVAEHGLDNPPGISVMRSDGFVLCCAMAALHRKLSAVMGSHDTFEERFALLQEEVASVARGDLVDFNGMESRSFCQCLNSFTYRLVSEAFDAINNLTVAWDENLPQGAQHGFTIENAIPVAGHLVNWLTQVEHPDRIHEAIERELEIVWDCRYQDLIEEDRPDSGSEETPELRVTVDDVKCRITINETSYEVNPNAAAILKALVDAGGDWISIGGLGYRSRYLENLPPDVAKLIERERGKGSRIPAEKLCN